jgi:chromosome segregation ATPase
MRGVLLSNKLISLFVLALCASLFGMSAQSHPQDASQKPADDPVADAARKSREKKKETAKPKKVYTNEDMGELKSGGVSTVGQDSSAAAAPKEGDPNQAAKPGEKGDGADKAGNANQDQEKVWRDRFRQAYGKLAQLEKELDILQREDNKAQVQYYSDPQKAMKEGYTRKDINETTAKIDTKKKEIDQQKQHISDLEDDLRKAGGDPGWASPQ